MLLIISLIAFSFSAHANPLSSSLYPQARSFSQTQTFGEDDGQEEGYQTVMRRSAKDLRGYTELLPYVMAAPDQLEAGSCLYMSLTGIAEWWLARLHPELSRHHDGPVDLSERHLMNLAGSQNNPQVKNWITDSIFFFNKSKGAFLNRDYRFTKGWYLEDEDGEKQPVARGTKEASYDEGYNWIDETDLVDRSRKIKLPKFKREILFADPEEDPWNTGVMPANIVERIKAALVRNKAPVHIIYNHFGYWHANYIVGFDDNADNEDCRFVRDFLTYTKDQPGKLKAEAATALDQAKRDSLLGRARLAEKVAERTQRAFDQGGGCHPRGYFYVRDSAYPEEQGPLYDYDKNNVGEEEPLTRKVVLLEYDWVRYMANHATQILVEE